MPISPFHDNRATALISMNKTSASNSSPLRPGQNQVRATTTTTPARQPFISPTRSTSNGSGSRQQTPASTIEGNAPYIPTSLVQKHAYFCYLLALVQTGILIAMITECGLADFSMNIMIGPGPDVLSWFGAKNVPMMVSNGEYWRFFTPALLHGGVLHLLGNLFFQLDEGAKYEREWGSFIVILVYTISTFGGSLFSSIVVPQKLGVGSSGALLGLLGCRFSEIFCKSCSLRKNRADKRYRWEEMKGVIFCCILIAAFSFIPMIDWAAHLGGFVFGLCSGFVLFVCHSDTRWYCSIFLPLAVFALLALCSVGLEYIYSGDYSDYEYLLDVCGYIQAIYEDYTCTCTYTLSDAYAVFTSGEGEDYDGGGGGGG